MKNLEKYEGVLEDLKRYFLEDLKELEVISALIYGSATYEVGFKDGLSDIDICIFTEKMYTKNYNSIVDIINKNTEYNFIDKKPSIITDHIADRIEFYIKHPKIAVDITIMAPELPNIDDIENTASHDSTDMLLGAFYQYGIELIGEKPQKEMIEKRFFPFYEDSLREKRLHTLEERIKKYNGRIQNCIETGEKDILNYIYKGREYFLKWLFIYNRKYPVNLYKHLEYQLSKILNLSNNEIENILFIGDKNIFKLASEYLHLVNSYLKEYNCNSR